jgi:hypothetical protein
VELATKASALHQMLLELLDHPKDIQKMTIMGRTCTISTLKVKFYSSHSRQVPMVLRRDARDRGSKQLEVGLYTVFVSVC